MMVKNSIKSINCSKKSPRIIQKYTFIYQFFQNHVILWEPGETRKYEYPGFLHQIPPAPIWESQASWETK